MLRKLVLALVVLIISGCVGKVQRLKAKEYNLTLKMRTHPFKWCYEDAVLLLQQAGVLKFSVWDMLGYEFRVEKVRSPLEPNELKRLLHQIAARLWFDTPPPSPSSPWKCWIDYAATKTDAHPPEQVVVHLAKEKPPVKDDFAAVVLAALAATQKGETQRSLLQNALQAADLPRLQRILRQRLGCVEGP